MTWLRFWREGIILALTLSLAGAVMFARHQSAVMARQAVAIEISARDLKAAREAISDRDAMIAANAATASQEAQELAALSKSNCKGAFNAGYASRRCDVPVPAGVSDLRALWAADAGSGGLPAEPESPDLD